VSYFSDPFTPFQRDCLKLATMPIANFGPGAKEVTAEDNRVMSSKPGRKQ
jgi:hypothetical protein